MTENWRLKITPKDEEDLDEDEDYQVKPSSYPHRRNEDDSISSSSKCHQDDRKYTDYKSYRNERRGNSSRSRKSRSRSRSREKDRSRHRDRDHRRHDERRQKHDRYRPLKSRDERDHVDHKYSHSNKGHHSGKFESLSHSKTSERVGKRDSSKSDQSNSSGEAVDICAATLLKNIPPEAAKLKEEVEKRKLLWGKKDKPAELSVPLVWKQTAFSDDSDGKVSAKFQRLMGMRAGEGTSGPGPSSQKYTVKEKPDAAKNKQDEYFANLEKQYEVARATTHTQRGLGLGFTSRILPR